MKYFKEGDKIEFGNVQKRINFKRNQIKLAEIKTQKEKVYCLLLKNIEM